MPHRLSTCNTIFLRLFRRSGSHTDQLVKRIISAGLIAILIQFSGCSDNAASLDGPPPEPPIPSLTAPAVASDSTVAVQQTQAAFVKVANAEAETHSLTQTVALQDLTDGKIAPPAETQEGVLQKAGDLFDRAKSSTGSTAKAATGAAKGAKDWVQDKIGGASDASSAAAEDTLKWATDTFESLKSQGLTTATDTSDWLSQDWKNMESWEYKIITLSEGNDDEKAAALNELGKNGWECYHVSQPGRSIDKFYLKKRKESYLRHLPFNDFIKLVPLMQQANQ